MTLRLHGRKVILAYHLLCRLVVVAVGAVPAEVRLPYLRLTVHSIHARIPETGALAHLTLQRRALPLSARLPVLTVVIRPDYWVVTISFYTLEPLLAVDTFSGVSKVHLDTRRPVRA